MEAYKFETTVLENGVIQLPQISNLANQEVEIFIVLKQKEKKSEVIEKQTMDQFLDKWRGFFKEGSPGFRGMAPGPAAGFQSEDDKRFSAIRPKNKK